MPHAIIRGRNGRRHEVDFGNEAVRVEIHASEDTVEIFIEADFETLPEQRRRFAPFQHPPPPVQRSHRHSGATYSEVPRYGISAARLNPGPQGLVPESIRVDRGG